MELKDTNTKCQKEYILSIFNVTERDEGTYRCYWLCADENTATKASIDLNVIDDDLQSTGKNFHNFCFASKCFLAPLFAQLFFTTNLEHVKAIRELTESETYVPDGLIAQLVENYTGIAEVMGSNPVQT